VRRRPGGRRARRTPGRGHPADRLPRPRHAARRRAGRPRAALPGRPLAPEPRTRLQSRVPRRPPGAVSGRSPGTRFRGRGFRAGTMRPIPWTYGRVPTRPGEPHVRAPFRAA
jgi:hypothetical protein